jgi:hypothetical protein
MAAYRAQAPNIDSLLSLESEAFVRQAYRRLLNREADPSGLNSCLQQLRAGIPKEQILVAMESTPEGRLAVRKRGGVSLTTQMGAGSSPAKPQSPQPGDVRQLLALDAREFLLHAYRLVVGRNGDPEGIASLSARMADGVTAAQVLREMASSDEAKAYGHRLAGLSEWLRSSARPTNVPEAASLAQLLALPDDHSFLHAAYWHVLGRAADPPGFANLEQKLVAGATRERIVQDMAGSEEGMAAGHAGLPGLAEWLESGAPPAKPSSAAPRNVQELLALNAREFLLHAYVLVLGREADGQGLESLSARMADGMTATQALRELALSGEAATFGHHLAGLPEWLQSSAVRPADVPNVADLAELFSSADDRSFLNAVYWFLLGRPADASGFAHLEQLIATGTTRERIVQQMADSDEGIAAGRDGLPGLAEWLEAGAPPAKPQPPQPGNVQELLALGPRDLLLHAYPLIVGRDADREGLESLSARIATGVPATQVLSEMASSDEARAYGHRLAGLSEWLRSSARPADIPHVADVAELLTVADDRSFLRAAYWYVLGRPADAAGFEQLEQQIAAGAARERILHEMAASEEGVAAGRGGLDGLAAWLERAPMTAQRVNWQPADVEELLAIPDEDAFLGAAYGAVLGRPMDPLGYESSKALLQLGWSRLYILHVLRSSEEGRHSNARLSGLDQKVRNYEKAQKRSLGGWYRRSVLGAVSDLPPDRQLRVLYQKMGG